MRRSRTSSSVFPDPTRVKGWLPIERSGRPTSEDRDANRAAAHARLRHAARHRGKRTAAVVVGRRQAAYVARLLARDGAARRPAPRDADLGGMGWARALVLDEQRLA